MLKALATDNDDAFSDNELVLCENNIPPLPILLWIQIVLYGLHSASFGFAIDSIRPSRLKCDL